MSADEVYASLLQMPSSLIQTYGERASKHKNPAARLLLETMERKKSNLAVSVDLTRTADFLSVIDTVGPYVCLIKARSYPQSINI